MIDYENKLNVITGVTTPPTETIKLLPVKDAYVDQGRPVEPFNLKVLEVGSSTVEDQNTSKSILYFKIPSITSDQYENLKTVKLIFRSTSPMGRTVNFQLKYNAHFSWPEDGTTWLSQPKEGRNIIQTKRLEKDNRTLVFDMMDLFKSHKNSEFDFPITLLEDPNDGTNDKITFGSKEANIALRPTFEIEYEYYPENLDYFDFKGKMNVRINVPNAVYDAPDLKGKINVWGGETYNDFNGTISTKTYSGDPSDLNGTVKVRRVGWNYFDGKVGIQRFVPNDQEPAPDFEGVVSTKLYKADSQEKVPADPYYLEHVDSPDLNGKIASTTYDGVPGDLNGFITINKEDDFDGKLTIRKYIADSDIDKSTDSEKHIDSPDFNSIITVRRNIADNGPTSDLKGKMMVNNLPGPGEINGYINIYSPETNPSGDVIPDLRGKVTIKLYDNNSKELDGHLTVTIHVPNETTPPPDLNGQLSIREYFADDDTAADTDDKKHVPSANLNAKVNVRHRADLDGIISIKTYYDQKDMPGQMNVIGFGDGHLDGYINIKGYKDLNCKMYSRYRKATDMIGVMIVGEGENAPFAFIM